MSNEELKPRIYVACLAAYNSGYLHGAWVDATGDSWTMWDAVTAMLKTSPIPDAEEWAIHDYEGFGDVRISEHTGLERIAGMATLIEEHGELATAMLEHCGGDTAEAREALEERYLGCHASLADYMQDVTEETTTIPHSLRYYIDWQAMARDAQIGGDLFIIETTARQVHVFAAI